MPIKEIVVVEALLEVEKVAQGSINLMEEVIPDELNFLDDDPDFNTPVQIDEIEHWTSMAMICIDSYFLGKSFHCGGSIPPKMLYSEKNVILVRDSVRLRPNGFGNVMSAIDEVLHTCSPLRFDLVDIQKPWDIALVIKLMREIQSFNIPKEFVPPLVLLNLKFCKGFNVGSDLIDSLL